LLDDLAMITPLSRAVGGGDNTGIREKLGNFWKW